MAEQMASTDAAAVLRIVFVWWVWPALCVRHEGYRGDFLTWRQIRRREMKWVRNPSDVRVKRNFVGYVGVCLQLVDHFLFF